MKSLRARLTLRLLLGGALLLGAAGAVLQWQMRRALTAQFDAALRATAQSIASLTEEKNGRTTVEFADETMPQFGRKGGSEVFLLRAADGREIARSPSLGEATLPASAGSAEKPAVFDTALGDGRIMRCAGLLFVPQSEEDDDAKKHREPRRKALLIVGRDRAPLDHTLRALRTSLGLVLFGTLAVLAVGVRWEVRRGLAPLDQLGESVAAVQAGSLATRFPVEPLPTELQPIALRLNELLARLESAFAREQRFTATAAHELRTPLAELRALAEVNLTTPAIDGERIESWRDTLATTLRMEALALRLLDLARAEDSARAIHREPVALGTAFAAAWQPWAATATERGLGLTVVIAPDIIVQTDAALLNVILANLCANAAEHAPANSPLRISAASGGARVALLFHNRAGDLNADDLPHLFERFWRKDAARTDARHHGLGLALASEFASLLGGSLTAQLYTGGALEIALHLPAA